MANVREKHSLTSGAPCKLGYNYLYPGLHNVEIASKTVVKLRRAGGHLRGLVSASVSQVNTRALDVSFRSVLELWVWTKEAWTETPTCFNYGFCSGD